ncbi:MAG TPA: pirin family protein, partial [Gemmataceae bacterium]|nr:pirin family protein [Gemmataceae bacterium]
HLMGQKGRPVMITVRPAADRGHTKLDWLDSWHSFSFGDYYDPANTQFRSLRVLNDDRVAPGGGFGMHPHRDFEILSYVVSGALEHKDSLGTGSVVRAGEVQRITAGTGVLHSEFNPSATEPVHFLQIWLTPERRGLKPGYEQKEFPEADRRGRLRLVASRDGRDESVTIHQDADVYATLLQAGETVTHELRPGRFAQLQVARGAVTINGKLLAAGDGGYVSDEAIVKLAATEPTELLLFDLA